MTAAGDTAATKAFNGEGDEDLDHSRGDGGHAEPQGLVNEEEYEVDPALEISSTCSSAALARKTSRRRSFASSELGKRTEARKHDRRNETGSNRNPPMCHAGQEVDDRECRSVVRDMGTVTLRVWSATSKCKKKRKTFFWLINCNRRSS